MWHSRVALPGQAAWGWEGGEEPEPESGYNRQRQTLEKGCWGGGGKTDKSQPAPYPSGSPASSRKGLAFLWEALGS